MESGKLKIYIIAVFILAFFNIYLWSFIFRLSGEMKVVFFDVGQGDSIFIESPQGHQILIDGGPSGKVVLKKLSKEIPFWDKTIDLIVLTHPDADHLSGLNSVLAKYKIENILWTGVRKGTKTFQLWEKNLKKEKEEGAKIFIARQGETIKAGKTRLYVLYPFSRLDDKFFSKDTNDTSIVLKLLFGQNSFLFTGDIGEKVEEGLVSRGRLLPVGLSSQVLKVAHHGSKSSSSRDFLEKVSPRIAVISVGRDNHYGHPNPVVLQRLREFGIRVLRTDNLGNIKIFSDGENLDLKPQVSKIKNKNYYGLSNF